MAGNMVWDGWWTVGALWDFCFSFVGFVWKVKLKFWGRGKFREIDRGRFYKCWESYGGDCLPKNETEIRGRIIYIESGRNKVPTTLFNSLIYR